MIILISKEYLDNLCDLPNRSGAFQPHLGPVGGAVHCPLFCILLPDRALKLGITRLSYHYHGFGCLRVLNVITAANRDPAPRKRSLNSEFIVDRY